MVGYRLALPKVSGIPLSDQPLVLDNEPPSISRFAPTFNETSMGVPVNLSKDFP